MKQKCPYVKCCTLYDKNGVTCNEDGGDYYGPGRMAGCGRELRAKGKKAYCYKQPTTMSPNYKQPNKSTNWRAVAIGLTCLSLFLTGRAIYLLTVVYR
jgi:hypothetical protein